jgi:hypothetical protein
MVTTVHPTSLPDGAVGYPYDAALAGSGGHEPYDFNISRGTLPTGVTLTGAVLSGTATVPGNFSFTILMLDATSETASRSYSVDIFPMTPTIVVEDGSVVDGANSYLSLADLYASQAQLGVGDLEISTLKNLSVTTQTNLLIWATAYLERRFRFYGQTIDSGQTLQWPRTRNFDIRGWPIETGNIPIQLKQGQALLVTAAAANPQVREIENTAFSATQQSWSMDGVSITSAQNPANTPPVISAGLANLLFEQQLPDLLVLLRSIGELKTLDWVTTDRQTVINR